MLIVVSVWPALPEKVQESEGDGEQAEENVRQRQVGDEHIPGGQQHLQSKSAQELHSTGTFVVRKAVMRA